MALLDVGDHAELRCQIGEALLLGLLGEGGVHVGPLVVLALGCGEQVCGGVAQATQGLEPHLGVLLLVVGGLLEDHGDLLVAGLLCDACEIGVLVAGLGLAGERGSQILFSLAAFQFHNINLLVWIYPIQF